MRFGVLVILVGRRLATRLIIQFAGKFHNNQVIFFDVLVTHKLYKFRFHFANMMISAMVDWVE
eukprot:scaffold597_cov176-Amphora_coffeaeformis.AAC.7